MSKVQIGDTFKSRVGEFVVVVSYKNANEIKVQFQDQTNYVTNVSSGNLRKGAFKNPYKPSICGVGYLGVGPYSSGDKGSTKKSYLSWRSMLIRCYNEDYINAHPSYKDCCVSEEWHNFQNFAGWYERQPNAGKSGFDLDKDLFVLGNKIYSPDTCSFVPQEINKLLCSRSRDRGDLPQGVCRHGRRFKSSINIEGRRVHIGVFESEQEAHIAYRNTKEEYVRIMANKYKDVLHPVVYENLMNWTLDAIESKG